MRVGFVALTPAEFVAELIEEMRLAQEDYYREHSHVCDGCGEVWSHTGAKAGSDAAHMCPKCHTGPYWGRL